jgi:NAD(P)-dependent dehydrogenase (short-subunit alcohol dehydrogenase family)
VTNSHEIKSLEETSQLQGQVAIVTGGASGIGRAIAIRFAQEGVKVAIFDIDLPGAQQVTNQIDSSQKPALAFQVDITQPDQVETALDKVIEQLGQINILVNNAGISNPVSLAHPQAVTNWHRVLDTNLTGAFYVTRAVTARMTKSHWVGSIINITSVHSQVPTDKGSDYLAAKAGLAQATKGWALDLAPHNIRVNAIAPGAIRDTGMNKDINDQNDHSRAQELRIPLERHGTPEEIAHAALFLVTNPYITGHELVIDGGFTLTH